MSGSSHGLGEQKSETQWWKAVQRSLPLVCVSGACALVVVFDWMPRGSIRYHTLLPPSGLQREVSVLWLDFVIEPYH